MQGVRSPRYGALPWRFPALGFVLILFLAFQLSLYFWVVTPGLHFPAQGAVPHCIGPELVPPTKYGPITVNAKDYSCPLNPRPLFDRTATERQCDESHSFALISRFQQNNMTFCTPRSSLSRSHMHCLEAENCYICRGSNLVVDFSKIKAPKKRGFDLTGRLSHLVYSDGAFGMSGCELNRRHTDKKFAALLQQMWNTWTDYDEPPQCDVVVEHPVIFIVRWEAWNLWHQLGDWFCAFVSNIVLGVEPQEANTQVIFFDEHNPTPLVAAYSLFSPHRGAKRALSDTDWENKKVCFRDAIFPYEGYGAVFERNGNEVSVGDPCASSDLMLSLPRWMLSKYKILEEEVASVPSITLISRKANEARSLKNQVEVIKAINTTISEVYQKQRDVQLNVVDLAELEFEEQLRLMWTKTNILIGVHGAGMSHLIFLPPEAVVIELVPRGFQQKIFFRNMAKQTNKVYFAVPMDDNTVALDRLLPILDAAVAIANSFGKNIYPFS